MESQLKFGDPLCFARDEIAAGEVPCNVDTLRKSGDDSVMEAHLRYLSD
ncbi:MAG: hypothetical protein HZB26_00550 [Candidatus Hydrogenedentes bacterium]|nr:hypothetical protein [Candidatus Hydrogenedentota bacterium]